MFLVKSYWILMNLLLYLIIINELNGTSAVYSSSSTNVLKDVNICGILCIFLFLINYKLLKKNEKLEKMNKLKKVFQTQYCVICFSTNSCIIFRPCNHLCTCAGCYIFLLKNRLNSCPVCQNKNEGYLVIFQN